MNSVQVAGKRWKTPDCFWGWLEWLSEAYLVSATTHWSCLLLKACYAHFWRWKNLHTHRSCNPHAQWLVDEWNIMFSLLAFAFQCFQIALIKRMHNISPPYGTLILLQFVHNSKCFIKLDRAYLRQRYQCLGFGVVWQRESSRLMSSEDVRVTQVWQA